MRLAGGGGQPQASCSGRAPAAPALVTGPRGCGRRIAQHLKPLTSAARGSAGPQRLQAGTVSELAAEDGKEDFQLALSPDAAAAVAQRSVELSVKGLRSEECVACVTAALQQVDGVLGTDAGAALADGIVTVTAAPETSIRALMEAVRKTERGIRAVPYRERTWHWRGHACNYSVAGPADDSQRPPLVLVHGFGGNCHHWRKATADLCERYTVYAPDLLGFGASAKPAGLAYDPHLWCEQVCAFAAEVVGRPAVLVGNSIGSQVALYVAAERPDLAAGVCLLNCSGGMNQRGLYSDSARLAAARPLFELLQWALKRKAVAAWLFAKFSDRERIEQLLRMKGTPYANPEAVHSELVDIFVDPSLDSGAVDVFVSVFTGDPGPRPEALLPRVACPVLVAWGDADPWTPIDGTVATFFQRQAARREDLEFVPLPGTGHSPQDDRPELVAEALLPWLAKLEQQQQSRPA